MTAVAQEGTEPRRTARGILGIFENGICPPVPVGRMRLQHFASLWPVFLHWGLGLGRVDKLNPDLDAGKQHEGGEALDQLVVAGGDTA